MRKNNSAISLGDFARAIRELGISDYPTRKLVAEMLGMSLEEKREVKQSPDTTFDKPKQDDMPEEEINGNDPPERQKRVEPLPDRQHRPIPIDVGFSPSKKEEWIEGVEPLPQQVDGIVETAALVPLLMPQWTRGILSAALATNAEDGPPDIEAITELLAGGENIQRLPTLPSRTMRKGLHLLTDKSQAMMPFFRDQSWLVKEIEKVTGGEKVEVFRFTGSPLRGAGNGPKPWPTYQPPLPGTLVVLLTDLGICQPMLATDYASEQEWIKFSEMIIRARCPLLALVPYKPSRWPAALVKLMNIIQWDRNTTAATVNSIIKRFREVTPQ